MVRLLGGLSRFLESDESPREITPRSNSTAGESGWLIRFFDSAFFCEWIAVSYLYKHDHAGVRDYLCNRMYTLPLSGIESYLFQICYMMVHKPSPSLDKFVIDISSKSLKIAMKVHWFLLAELEDNDDNEGISRIQEKCQIAATLMGEWTPLIGFQNTTPNPGSKNQVLNKILSSKQKLLSLTSSPPAPRSLSFSPSSTNNLLDDECQCPEENKILRRFIPGPKVRDALLFRKSVDKEEEGHLPEDSSQSTEDKKILRKFLPGPKVRDAFLFRKSVEKEEEEPSREDGNRSPEEKTILKKFMPGTKVRDALLFRKSVEKDEEDLEKDGFFKRLLRESKGEDEEVASSSDGFFKRLLRDSKSEDDHSKSKEDQDEAPTSSSDGFLKKFLRDNKGDEEDLHSDNFLKKLFRDSKSDSDDKFTSKSVEEDEKDGFFKKFFKEKFEDKKDLHDKNGDGNEEKNSKSSEYDEKDGSFWKFLREKFEDKKDGNEKSDETTHGEDAEPSEFSLFKKLFRVHPEEARSAVPSDYSSNNGLSESSPGTEKFFRKLFRDRDRSVEDSELFGLKKHKEVCFSTDYYTSPGL